MATIPMQVDKRKINAIPDLSDLSDKALLKRFSYNEDSSAMAILYERHHVYMERLAGRLLSKYNYPNVPEGAKDATMAVFERMIANPIPFFATKVDGRENSILHQAVVNDALMLLRREIKISRHELPSDSCDSTVTKSPYDDPLRCYINAKKAEAIKDAVANMNPTNKHAFVLKHLQGLQYPEISKALEVPTGTLKAHVARAKKELREKLRDYRPS